MSEKYNRVNWAVSILVASLSALPLGATAAGLGKLTVLSSLGQPLRAELDVSASKDELTSLSAKIAAPDAFRQANIEYSGNFSALRFTLDKRPNGQPYFKLTSDRAISDPFMDVLIELNWPAGRLMREYTFLLDPPESQAAESVASSVTRPTVSPVAAIPRDARKPEVARSKAMPKVSDETAPAGKPRSSESNVSVTDGSTQVVKPGDTLAKIAAETKPADVNLDQMLVALFRANPDAFDRGNMNRLRAGKILSVPSGAAATEVSPAEARKEVRAHSGDFEAYKRKLAGMAAGATVTEEPAAKSAAGRITPKVEEKAPTPIGKDKLEVSRTETSKALAPGKSKAAEEDGVAREKSLKDAQSRISELEKNVAEMKRLVELKNQAAADLQKNAKSTEVAKTPAPVVTPPPVVVPAPVKPAEPPKVAEAPKEISKPVEPPKPVSIEPPPAEVVAPVAPAVQKPIDAPKPPPVAKPIVAATPEPDEESGFIEGNLPLIAGGGGILALLAGYFGFKAWRRRKGEAESSSSLAESALAGSSVFTAASTGHGSSTDLTGQVSEFGPIADGFGAGEGVDPVREAETYLAYGRDVQAEEILLDALKRDPSQPAVHLKLLEIYAGRKSVLQFNAIATELRSFTGGHGADWVKAGALGREVDPSNPLYSAEAVAPLEAVDTLRDVPVEAPVTAVEISHDAPTQVFGIEQATRTVVIPAPGGIAAALEQMSVPAVESIVDDEIPDKLDFDLDLGEAEATPEISAEAPRPDVGEIDFDILAEPEDAATIASDVLAAEASNVIDFDLALPDVSPVAEPIVASVESSGDLDFNFDLGESSLADTSTTPVATLADELDDASLVETLIVDSPRLEPRFLDASLEETQVGESGQFGEPQAESSLEDTLVVPEVAATEPAPFSSLPAEFADIDLELTDTFVMPAAELTDAKSMAPTREIEPENPEAATKLELAQAYEEMGDKEGARELLQEVVAEGNPVQKSMAQDRLARLD